MTNRSILPAVWQVPQEFRDRLGDRAGRQRAMAADGHLLLVLHRPPGPEDAERSGRFFWRKPDGVWSSNDLGSGINALNRHLNEYAEILEKLEAQDDAAANAGDYFQVLYHLSPIHRAARNMHQTLQEARKLFPDDRDLINCRDRAYELERMSELLENDARQALNYLVAKRTEEQAESSHRMATAAHRLNVLAAFFFPLVTLSAIFGVNLVHGLETANPPIPFFVVLAAGLMLGFVLKAFVTTNTKAKSRG
jgi:hypothetical protein